MLLDDKKSVRIRKLLLPVEGNAEDQDFICIEILK